MSPLVGLITPNVFLFFSTAVYVISPSLRNPAHTVLNAASTLAFSDVIGKGVILVKMSLVIGSLSALGRVKSC